MTVLTKKFEFSASHKLYRNDWDKEKNWQVYGKCSNPNGHGHNYVLEVSVAGEMSPETFMVIDAAKLQSMVEEVILHELDHKNLNTDVEWLQNVIPTAEALVEIIWQRLSPVIEEAQPRTRLYKLVLHETSRIYATRYADER